MIQLELFPMVLKTVLLKADSTKKAWWKLSLLEHNDRYFIEKQSGYMDKMLDRRWWPMADLDTAVLTFEKKVKQKLNPKRKSPRKYKITDCNY